MKTFERLEIEKQDQVLNGAMRVFAAHGYSKASMSEIARAAGVSKPTLFYHFGTKLELYFYVLDVAFREISQSLDVDSIYHQTDFFECLKVSTEHKMIVLRKRPSLMKFLTTFYFETAEDVVERKEKYLELSANMRNKLVFEDLDVSKFKSTVDPQMVMDMLLKWTEGYIALLEKSTASEEEISSFYDSMIADFLALIEMLRINFYKPEYL